MSFEELDNYTTIDETQLVLTKLGKPITRQRIDKIIKTREYQAVRINRIHIYKLEDMVQLVKDKTGADADNIKVLFKRARELRNTPKNNEL